MTEPARKQGRPKGPSNLPSVPRADSRNEYLSTFEIGEVRYVETELKAYQQTMQALNTPPSRRPDSMKGMRFTTELWRALSAANIENSVYLIKVTRVS